MRSQVKPPILARLVLVALLLSPGLFAAEMEESVPAYLTLRVPSQILAETRVVNVLVPVGYAGKAETTYPVLYMPDGGIKEDFPHVATVVDALIRSGEIPPMLLVGIENTERRRDLTGPTEVESDRAIAPAVGGSEAFRGFVSSELMPLIRTLYRVNDESAVIGESLAGLFVVETLFVQPELFDMYIALDPSLWWNAQQWWREAGSRLNDMAGVHARFLLASAGDSGNAADNLADALCRHPVDGLNWTHVPRLDLRHDNIFRSLEHTVLRQMFSGQELAAPDCSQDAGN